MAHFASLYLNNMARLATARSIGGVAAAEPAECPREPPIELRYFYGPRYVTDLFVQAMNLIDTALHRLATLDFCNSVIAAGAVAIIIRHFSPDHGTPSCPHATTS